MSAITKWAVAIAATGALVVAFAPTIATYGLVVAIWGLPPAVIGLAWVGFVDGDSANAKAALVAALAALAVFIWITAAVPGRTMARAAVVDVSSVDTFEELPGFVERAPYIQALPLLRANTGDFVGTMARATYISAEIGWCGLVEGDGFFRPTTGVICWDGSGNTPGSYRRVELDLPSPSGVFGNNLKAHIRRTAGVGFLMDPEDSYAYITPHGDPVVVWPMTRYRPGLNLRVPAGVATVAADGTVEIHHETDDIAGPSYPITLATKVRESNKGLYGFWNLITGRRGYQHGSQNTLGGGSVTDADDPSGSNPSEYTLAGVDGGLYYVTPLTRIGSSESIVAYTVVDAQAGAPGTFAETSIIELPNPIKANAEIGDAVRTRFPDLGWAAGLGVMEVTPTVAGERVVSIGRTREVPYRATITPEGDITLRELGGDTVEPGTPTADRLPGIGDELSGLTIAELVALAEAILAEIAARS